LISLIFELITYLGSLASLAGLAIVLHDPKQGFSPTESAVMATAVILAIICLILRVHDVWNQTKRAISLNGHDKIKAYLYNWIARGQRVVIFSRDMSWADDKHMLGLLHEKSKRHELELCLPRDIPLSAELAQSGADVYTYSDLDYIPTSRFTIINPGRHDAQVAIGRTVGHKHLVREISGGDDGLFAVANDLTEVVKRSSRLRKAAEVA
jgi:hypothetical protein